MSRSHLQKDLTDLGVKPFRSEEGRVGQQSNIKSEVAPNIQPVCSRTSSSCLLYLTRVVLPRMNTQINAVTFKEFGGGGLGSELYLSSDIFYLEEKLSWIFKIFLTINIALKKDLQGSSKGFSLE